MPRQVFQSAFKLSLPILFAYFPFGMIFGILFNHHFDWYLAPVMSVLVYAGAVQIVAVSMLSEGKEIWTILLTTMFIALRNVFYGIHMLDRFRLVWYKKWFLVYGLVDATYAILTTHRLPDKRDDESFCLILTALIFSYWVAGTVFGALFSEWIPQLPGLEFILISFFMVVVIEQYLAIRKLQPFILTVVATLFALLINPENMIMIALLTVGVLFYISHLLEPRDES